MSEATFNKPTVNPYKQYYTSILLFDFINTDVILAPDEVSLFYA